MSADYRVKIAEDVIASIKASKLIPDTGNWVYVKLTDEKPETQLQDIVNNKSCTVCALGALFVEAVRIKDELLVQELSYGNTCNSLSLRDVQAYLKDIFTHEQLMLIEMAYEYNHGNYHPTDLESDKVDMGLRAVAFGLKYNLRDSSNEERMIAIMQNIIDNNGEFIP